MTKRMLFLVALSFGSISVAADDQEVQALRKQVEELTERVAKLEKMLSLPASNVSIEVRVEQQRLKARARMKSDSQLYSPMQLRDIESLYQVANKRWQTEEGINSLKELIKKYDKANRTGCALLYLGQMSEGEDKLAYLNQAIDQFGDCWYGDGVQVGAYARFILASHFITKNQSENAKELFAVIKKDFPDSIDHKGQLLANLIPESTP